MIAHAIPCDPVALYLGGPAATGRITPEQEALITRKLGLDQPLHIQYLIWIKRLVQGDLGTSFVTWKPVIEDIKIHIFRSLELVHVAFLLTLIVGIPTGVVCAVKRNAAVDYVIKVFSLAGTAAPIFWIAMILQIIFYYLIGVLPLRGMVDISVFIGHPIQRITGMPLLDSFITGNTTAFISVLKHMILPSTALMFDSLARIVRQTRSAMLDVLPQDYMRTAHAYGLPDRLIIFKYAMKNALIPVVTVMGFTYTRLMMGTFLIEAVFDWPGIGLYSVTAFIASDYPAILGVTIVTSAVVVIVNLVVDIVYLFIDPRIKL